MSLVASESSVVAAYLKNVADVRKRLRNPKNAVVDHGIDLKRKPSPAAAQPAMKVVAPKVVHKISSPKSEAKSVAPVETIAPPAGLQITYQWRQSTVSITPQQTVIAKETNPYLVPSVLRASLIIDTVARHFLIDRVDLLSHRRTNRVVLPRQIAMYLTKKLSDRSFPGIGKVFGDRDHTTVMHAIRKVETLMSRDPGFAETVELLRARILDRCAA